MNNEQENENMSNARVIVVNFPKSYQSEYAFPERAMMILVKRYDDRGVVKAHDSAESIDVPASWLTSDAQLDSTLTRALESARKSTRKR